MVTVSYTVLKAERPLTKRVSIDEHGAMVKQAAVHPMRGVFTAIECTGTADQILDHYCEILRRLTVHEAIIAAPLPSPFRDDGTKWELTTKDLPLPAALPRSQSTFSHRPG